MHKYLLDRLRVCGYVLKKISKYLQDSVETHIENKRCFEKYIENAIKRQFILMQNFLKSACRVNFHEKFCKILWKLYCEKITSVSIF